MEARQFLFPEFLGATVPKDYPDHRVSRMALTTAAAIFEVIHFPDSAETASIEGLIRPSGNAYSLANLEGSARDVVMQWFPVHVRFNEVSAERPFIPSIQGWNHTSMLRLGTGRRRRPRLLGRAQNIS